MTKNEQIKADLRGALSPFWNLVALMTMPDETLPEDKRAYVEAMEQEAFQCVKQQERILALINSIE